MKNAENNRTSISVLAGEYLDMLVVRRYSRRSIDTYGRAIDDFIRSVKKRDVRRIGRRDVEQYRARLFERGFKPSSVVVYFQALKLFFRHLEDTQCIFENPLGGLAPVRQAKTVQPVPTEEEIAILLAAPDVGTPLGVRDRALLETAYSTGVRRQEIVDMKAAAVDLAEGRVRVMGKGSRERMLPLGAEAVGWLRKYLEQVRPALRPAPEVEALWVAKNGRPLDVNALQAIIGRYRAAPRIVTHIGLHSIRRACATHMLRRGASPLTIQMLLGHASMEHLGQYLRLSLSDIKRMHEGSRVGR